jgi:hypothetical protein
MSGASFQALMAPVAASGGGGGGFSPLTGLTGLIGWWDASVYASLSLSGSNITAVADQSSAGNTITASAGWPVYSATGFNSKPAMLFAATGNSLQRAAFAFGTGNALTIFCVGEFTSSSSSYGRILSYCAAGDANDAASNASFLLSRESTTTDAVLYRNGNIAHAVAGYSTNRRIIATISSSGVMTIYIDGVATTGATLNAAFGATGLLALGGVTGGSVSPMDGAIAEMGVATGYTSATNVASLDSYLKAKWGL